MPSLEEECEASLCTSALRARNLELSQDMKKMTAGFEKLQTYIALLALPSKCLCYSWFSVKSLEYKKLEKGGGLACLRRAQDLGPEKLEFISCSPLYT